MSLADCLKKLNVSDALAAEITETGLKGYEAGLMEDLESLRTQLTEQGFDVPAVVVERPSARELFQGFGDATATPEFKEWAGGEDVEVIEPHDINDHDFTGEQPVVVKVYHGTTHDFEAFDATQGSIESHFGRMNYFTSDEQDAHANYAGEGPDLTSRIEREAEQLVDDIQDVIDRDGIDDAKEEFGEENYNEDTDVFARNVVRNRGLHGGNEQVLELYVKMEKPFIVGGEKQFIDMLDMETSLNEAREQIADDESMTVEDLVAHIDDGDENNLEDMVQERSWELQQEEENPVVEAINRVANRFDVDASDVLNAIYENGESMSTSDLDKLMRGSDDFNEAQDDSGELANHQIISDVIEELGYDSIILKNASEQFSSMDMGGNTAHVHIFHSGRNNIKSVDNVGTFSKDDPRILHQGGFQSNIESFVQNITQAKGSGDQFLAQIKKTAGIKEEEISWIGLDEFLKGKKVVTKQEMLDFIKANEVSIEEVVLGGGVNNSKYNIVLNDEETEFAGEDTYDVVDPSNDRTLYTGDYDSSVSYANEGNYLDREDNTKYSEYTLPGGENYREVLMTMPNKDGVKISGYVYPEDEDAADSILHDMSAQGMEDLDYGRTEDREGTLIIEFTDLSSAQHKEVRQIARDSGQVFIESKSEGFEDTYSTSHFPDQKNILAHLRLNDRTDADGNKVLFIEEIQSDWHQDGRKKGYKDGEFKEKHDALKKKNKAVFHEMKKHVDDVDETRFDELAEEHKQLLAEIRELESADINSVPDAPLKKSWHEMAMRRAIQLASEGDYDSIAWTTGEQQAERFDLSKQVHSVYAQKVDGGYKVKATALASQGGGTVSDAVHKESELENVVGKDLAKKIVDDSIDYPEGKSYAGLDLKVGGEGMKGFYDKMLPKYAGKFGKKFGAKVGVAKITGQAPATNEDMKLLDDLGVKGTGSNTTEVWSLPITDEMRESAKQGISLFQENRASIQFSPSGTTINLGLGSDRSSFLHESGHLYLEQLRQDQRDFGTQNEQLVDDWNIVTKWWGKNAESLKQEAISMASKSNDDEAVEVLLGLSNKKVKEFVETGDLDRSKDAQGYLSIAMHEQWARGVEDYFRTGQAPSIALQDAFNRFRAWMVSIYKKATGKGGLDIKFSKDVKEVMDRLLATDEEIELMSSQFDMKAMFGSAEEIGMTKSQFKNYQREVDRSVEEGKTRQLKKHLNEVERARKQWWKEEREVIKDEVSNEIHQRKEYQLMYALTYGTEPNGDALKVRFNRMDLKELNALLENDKTAKMLPKVKGRVLWATKKKEGSTDPGVVARAYGYEDAREMVKQLGTLAETAKAAREFDPTFKNMQDMDIVIAQETDARMKDKHGNMELTDQAEAAAIESIHGDKRGEVLILEVNALRDSQEKMKSAYVRKWAQEQIGKHKVNDIKPTKFLAAERRYAKLAAKEFKAGNRLDAQKAKFRQMMNYFMAKESYKVRAELDKSRKYMGKFNKKKAKFARIDSSYVDRIKEILGSYQLGPRLSDKKRLTIELAAFNEWIQRQMDDEGAILNVPAHILDADEKTHFRDLTLDEFRTLTDTIKNLEAQGRKKKGFIVDGQWRDIHAVVDEAVANISHLPQSYVSKKVAETRKAGAVGTVFKGLKAADAFMTKMEFFIESLDGLANGTLHKAVFQKVVDAEYRENVMVRDHSKLLSEKLDLIPKDIMSGMDKFVYMDKLGQKLNRSQLIHVALNFGNESNADKMMRGESQRGHAWTEEDIKESLQVLTKEEIDFINTVWEMFEAMRPDVEAVFKAENGVSPDWVGSTPVELENGTLTGGYIPMMYDPELSTAAGDMANKSALEMMQSEIVQASVFSGMTKARTNFAAPLHLDISRIPGELQKTAHFITHYEAIRDVKRIINHRDLSAAVIDKFGKEYHDIMKSWIGIVAVGSVEKIRGDVIGGAIENLRTSMTISALGGFVGGSVTTLLAQPLGLFTSLDALSRGSTGNDYKVGRGALQMAKGVMGAMTPSSIEKAKELSKELPFRIDNMDRDLKHALKKMSGMSGRKAEMQRWLLIGIPYIQLYVVDIPTFIGAYDMAINEGMSSDEAANFADSTMRKTQGSGAAKDQSVMMATRGSTRAVTMFMTFFNALYNIQSRLGREAEFTPKYMHKLITGAIIIYVLPSFFESLFKLQGPDEEDEQAYAEWLALKSLSMALTTLPIIRDVATSIISGFQFSATPISRFGQGIGQVFKSIATVFDEDEELGASDLKAISNVMGISGVWPSVFVNRIISAGEKGVEEGEVSFWEYAVGPKKE
mgnify:CR=1 FL=1